MIFYLEIKLRKFIHSPHGDDGDLIAHLNANELPDIAFSHE